MKRRLGPSTVFFPMPSPLIVGGAGDRLDVMAVAWAAVVAPNPPTFAMSLRETRRTLELIRETGEFTVNVPPTRLARIVDYCGMVSGRQADKIAEAGLTPVASAVVDTPILAECPYNLECRVTQEVAIGGYALVLAEIVETHVDQELVGADGRMDVDAIDPLVYIAGLREYRGVTPKVADAFQQRSAPSAE